jgi:hypothetical protein
MSEALASLLPLALHLALTVYHSDYRENFPTYSR